MGKKSGIPVGKNTLYSDPAVKREAGIMMKKFKYIPKKRRRKK